jgi:hypothetical protein
MIYSFALCHESQADGVDDYTSCPRLVAHPSETALALSQVSRSVRTDSMAVYYSETTCLVTKWRSNPPLVPLMVQ